MIVLVLFMSPGCIDANMELAAAVSATSACYCCLYFLCSAADFTCYCCLYLLLMLLLAAAVCTYCCCLCLLLHILLVATTVDVLFCEGCMSKSAEDSKYCGIIISLLALQPQHVLAIP